MGTDIGQWPIGLECITLISLRQVNLWPKQWNIGRWTQLVPHLSGQYLMLLVTCSHVFQKMFNSRTTGSPLKTGCQLWSKPCFGQETQLVALCGEPLWPVKLITQTFLVLLIILPSYGRRPTIFLSHFVYFVDGLGTCFFPFVFTLISEESTRRTLNALALSICR